MRTFDVIRVDEEREYGLKDRIRTEAYFRAQWQGRKSPRLATLLFYYEVLLHTNCSIYSLHPRMTYKKTHILHN